MYPDVSFLIHVRHGLILALVTLLVLGWALGQGATPLGWRDLAAAWQQPELPIATILWELRLPRVLLAAVAGACLAGAGALTQGLFRNPLADPGLLGVSAGAAAGAATAIVATLAAQVAPFACAGALGCTLLVYRLGRRQGQVHMTAMLLAGIAVNALVSAWLAFLSHTADDQQLRSVTFWMLGSFSGATWSGVIGVAGAAAVLIVAGMRLSPALNVLALGESEARHTGIAVPALQRACIVLTAVAVGVSVSVVGSIGFVGLIVPHALRWWIGPDYRRLFPLSMVVGAWLMVIADVAARRWCAPAELPVGIFTALVGAPFFLVLLWRQGRSSW